MTQEQNVSEEKKEEEKDVEEVEEKDSEETEDFEKSNETVSANKYNQALRKLREAELAKRELEKKIVPPAEEEEEGKEEEKEEEKPDVSSIVDEKVKPVLDLMKKREEEDRKKDRAAFFEAHPEYRDSGERWSGLLETMDEFIKPSSEKSYYEQLNAAHILYTGEHGESETAEKKREIAGDAASSGAGAQKANAKEEFTPDDRSIMKKFNISEEGMRAYKKKIESGHMEILG